MGSIPAWAGETLRRVESPAGRSVYPRVGGGNPVVVPIPLFQPGLSPRGRGKPAFSARFKANSGSIPAWAGETHEGYSQTDIVKVYPRVGGGNPFGKAVAGKDKGLSPRGRGKRNAPVVTE